MMKPFEELPDEERKRLIKAMLQRMAEAYGIERKELKQHLNTTKNVVNNWTYYMRIPFDQLLECSIKTGVSLDWLIKGEIPKVMTHDQKLEHMESIISIQDNVLTTGIEFGVIKVTSEDAKAILKHKFDSDLRQLLNIPIELGELQKSDVS